MSPILPIQQQIQTEACEHSPPPPTLPASPQNKTTLGSQSNLQPQAFVSSYGACLKPNQKVAGYPLTFMPLSHPQAHLVTLITIIVHRLHREVRTTVDDFIPQSSLHRSSGTMKTRQQGGYFLGSSNLIYPLWCLQQYSLTIKSGGQVKTVAQCIGVGVFRTH